MSTDRAPSSAQRAGRGRRIRRRFVLVFRTFWGKALLLVVFLVSLTLVAGGLVTLVFDDFTSYPSSVWWAVEHLIDPSQIGEDVGAGERAVGLVLVVVGLVVVLGVILEGFADVVARNVQRSTGAPLDPIDATDHFLVLGWKDSLPDVLRKIRAQDVAAGGDARIVVVAGDELRAEEQRLATMLRNALGERDHARRPLLLFGDVADPAMHAVASAQSARTIIVGAQDPRRVGPTVADVDNVKTAFALCGYVERSVGDHPWPTVVVEFVRGADATAARSVLPEHVRPLIWDRGIGALTALALTGSDWGVTAFRLMGLGHEPAGVYLVPGAPLAGAPFADVAPRLSAGLPLGVLTRSDDGDDVLLAPEPERPVGDEELVIVLAPDPRHVERVGPPRARPPATTLGDFRHHLGRPRRILLVGWNPRLVVLLERLAAYPDGHVAVGVLCEPSADPGSTIPVTLVQQLEVDVVHGSPLNRADLGAALERVAPDAVMVSSSEQGRDEDMRAADADAMVSLMHLRGLAEVPTLVNLFDPDDVGALGDDPTLDIVPTGAIVNAFLAKLAIDPGQIRIFQELFLRADRRLHTVEFHPADGRPARFADVYQGVLAQRCVVVGLVRPDPSGGSGVHLAPAPDTTVVPGDELLVVTTNEGEDLDAWLADYAVHASELVT